MADMHVLPADGEKLSAEQIGYTHVPHPGLGSFFRRSTLLIGTRGVGKTFLLRHRKHTAHSGAVYINLVNCLQSMSRDLGLGGRTLKYTAGQRSQIHAKTAALVAIAFLEQLLKDERPDSIAFRLEQLSPILVSGAVTKGKATLESIRALRLTVNRLRLREWPTDIEGTWPLAEVLSEINAGLDLPVALFMDRAEDVPAPALQVLLPLLDQSVEFLVVIAARPGLAQLIPVEFDPTLVPGDHFDIVHLGAEPYDDEWVAFSESAVHNFLEANGLNVSGVDSLTWASRLGRDSIRAAVTFAQISLGTQGIKQVSRRATRMAAFRNHQLATIRAELQPEHPDYAYTIRRIQQNFRQELVLRPKSSERFYGNSFSA